MQIVELPEYYPYRTELGMLQEHAFDIIDQIPSGSVIVELGCGTATKTAILLQALLKRCSLISPNTMRDPDIHEVVPAAERCIGIYDGSWASLILPCHLCSSTFASAACMRKGVDRVCWRWSPLIIRLP